MKPLSDLAAINEAMQIEMAQPKPSEAVLASCAMFKAMAERKRDKTIYCEPDMVDAPEVKLPWWVEL